MKEIKLTDTLRLSRSKLQHIYLQACVFLKQTKNYNGQYEAKQNESVLKGSPWIIS